MALRSAEEYRESLRDGRRIIYRGETVEDINAHASLGRTIDHAAGLFEHPSQGPEEFWSFYDPDIDEEVSAFFLRPSDAASLRRRGDVTEEATRRARSTLNIVKVVGMDALLGLEQCASQLDHESGTEYLSRIRQFRNHCARGDLAMALAATDSKGDRRLTPAQQHDPDLYLRVIDRDAEGITVRGAKLHTTAAPSANELICIPCRALNEEDRDYALAFAVPLNSPGLTLISHPLVDGNSEEHPVSSNNIEVETLTVFDDVKVPWERVFLCGEWAYAGKVAAEFANFHRYTAISYKPPFIDLMIGAAALAADQIGLISSAAVREKLGKLIVYGELVRTARLAAAERCTIDPRTNIAVPDSVANNAGKYHFASNFHQAVAILQDIAGGLTVTAPGQEDLRDPIVGPLVDKYLAGREGVRGTDRWKLIELIRDLTASEFGGYNYVVTLHGEGSQGAQLVQTVRDYDLGRQVAYAETILSGQVPVDGPAGKVGGS